MLGPWNAKAGGSGQLVNGRLPTIWARELQLKERNGSIFGTLERLLGSAILSVVGDKESCSEVAVARRTNSFITKEIRTFQLIETPGPYTLH